MIPKFRYWKGLSLALMDERADAVALFEQLVAQLPKTDTLQPMAVAQLEMLRSDSNTIAEQRRESISDRDERRVRTQTIKSSIVMEPQSVADDALPPEARVYRYREGQQYYVIILINDRHIKATELQYRLTDFNSQYYANSGYKVNAVLFTDTTQLLTIHRFKTADEAMGYYHHLHQEESPLRPYADADHQEFAISTQNYATFYNRKDPQAYLLYFRKHHLNK